MDNHKPIPGQSWDKGWDGHRKAQILRWAKLSFREKLEWLDDAQEMLESLKKAQEKTSSS